MLAPFQKASDLAMYLYFIQRCFACHRSCRILFEQLGTSVECHHCKEKMNAELKTPQDSDTSNRSWL
ncbi:hypothetical protein ACMFWY_13650 [Roseiconus sp. JC912]|uniref:hypothetical protein n=1 Tax=Roseiconus sp. JC912 TaxID=3396307 RepID=UPI003A4C70BE